METDDYFAKMMFNNISNEVYFDNCDDYTGNSDYGSGSMSTDRVFLEHRKTSQNLMVGIQKSEHITKYNQLILATSDVNGGGNVAYDEVCERKFSMSINFLSFFLRYVNLPRLSLHTVAYL